jgi:hypothetical protein
MDSNDKIVLDELHNDKNSFILCLVNQFFFIFNEKNNKTISYKLDFINNDLYVNLLPYKMEGKKISFIIVNHSQSKKLIFYYYDLSYIDTINDPKKIEFDEINIKKNIVSCQINSHLSIIKCFYSEYLNSKNYISIITFSINEMEIVKLNKLEEKEQNNINQIKSARSFNNKFFFCYTDNYVPNCLINDYSKNEENYIIGCEITDEYDLNYKTFYFNETGDFMLISKRTLTTTLYNSINDSIIICENDIFSEQTNEFSIIYDSRFNNYNLVNFSNFSDYGKCQNIFILKEDQIIQEITDKSKEEIISNIDDILKYKEVGLNYEIKGEDFTLKIKPTNATTLPNTTYVDFDECEKIIREKYGIHDSSIITFLQIEIDNDDKNSLYNQIKYFAYNEEMEELDLSPCEELDTKIHYAIKEDSNLDISSISEFQQLGVDILNIKDNFFTDLCYSYSDSNNDMTLEDRIKYIYQNYSLCEESCTYNSIDLENMNIACNCKVQGNNNESSLNMAPLVYEHPGEASFFDSNKF